VVDRSFGRAMFLSLPLCCVDDVSQVLAVLICMALIIAKLNVDWASALSGYIPSKNMVADGSVYICKRNTRNPHVFRVLTKSFPPF
jgi:hypothetical protein